MADTTTANIGLLIADLNDVFNFGAHVEANFTTIDGLMGLVKCTSVTRPSNTYGGQGIYETDTGRVAVNTNTKASPTWTYVTSVQLYVTSSTRPTLGLVNGLLIYESDTKAFAIYTSGAWRYVTTVNCTSSTRPASPTPGLEIYETDTFRTLKWNGSAWVYTAFGNWVTTSSTHPASPFQGLEIYETDTGLSAVYTGSSYAYGLQQIAPTQVLGSPAASVTFSGIPSGINTLIVKWRSRSSAAVAAEPLYLQLNGDTGSNYLVERQEVNNTTATNTGPGGATTTKIQMGTLVGANGTSLYFGSGSFEIGGGSADTTNYKTVQGTMIAMVTVSNSYIGLYGGQWNNASAVSSLTLSAATGNLVAGSRFSLYGAM